MFVVYRLMYSWFDICISSYIILLMMACLMNWFLVRFLKRLKSNGLLKKILILLNFHILEFGGLMVLVPIIVIGIIGMPVFSVSWVMLVLFLYRRLLGERVFFGYMLSILF